MTVTQRPLRWQLIAGTAVGWGLLVGLAVSLTAAGIAGGGSTGGNRDPSGAGLGVAGWLSGILATLALHLLLARAARRAGVSTVGPAGLVTLARAELVCAAAGLVAARVCGPGGAAGPAGAAGPGAAELGATELGAAALVALASTAIVLDGVDGVVARRTGTAGPFGARFDMEVDAALILVLSVAVGPLVGWWALGIGLMRYGFALVCRAVAWMRAPVPARRSARVVAATQGVTLTVVGSGLLPRWFAVTAVAAALALLVWSFGGDLRWLLRHRRQRCGHPSAPRRGPATARRDPRTPAPARRIGLDVAAGLLVAAALLAPHQPDQLTAAALARLPVEAVVGMILLLVTPARLRRAAAIGLGAALGALALLKLFDLGFYAALARPFHPVADADLLGAGVGFVGTSFGRAAAVLAVLLAVAVAGTTGWLCIVATGRLVRLVGDHPDRTARLAGGLAVAWYLCAASGLRFDPGLPVASADASTMAYRVLTQARADLGDRGSFAGALAVDAFRDTPPDSLLTGLRGKDVALVFVESYGRDAIEDPRYGPGLAAVLDDGGRRLAAAGFGARSGFLTSPIAGGGSWLAHATLLSGLWVDNQQRFLDLVGSDRLTLTRAFHEAGWRTVGVMPGLTEPSWPEAAFYGYDHVYDFQHLGYHGPNFSFDTVPDQFTLAAFERLERVVPHRGPVLAVIPLLASHAPWSPLPTMLGWDQLGDGSVYDTMTAPGGDGPQVILSRDPARVRADYWRSVQYSIDSLVAYLRRYGDDKLVLIMLGDHQPSPIVTGPDAGRDVPVTIVAKDPAVLGRLAGWGWHDGLRPDPNAPVWPMDAFRDRFLSAFGARLTP